MIAFLVLIYAVYMAALLVGGFGLRSAIFPGPAPFGADGRARRSSRVVAIVVFLLLAFAARPTSSAGSSGTGAADGAGSARAAEGGRGAGVARRRRAHSRSHQVRDPRPGAARDARAGGASTSRMLWASVQGLRRGAAAGRSSSWATSSGMLANLLPLPGGIGGVDGGMIGAFSAFGVTPASRSSPCWSTARSRSGCRRSPARSRTSSCGARSRAGGKRA